MSNSEKLQITSSQIEKMTPSQLEKFAEEKSKFILEKIELSTKKIAEAKEVAKAAKQLKTGAFGKTQKKADATANAVIVTNEAVAEMNEILKESIKFTCSSIDFAQAMAKYMLTFIQDGFKNQDGELVKLSSDSEEQAMFIVHKAEEYANNQLEIDVKQAAQDSKIDNLYEIIDFNSKLLNEKEKIDAEQTQRLEELGALLSNKDLVDQKQEEAIRILFEYTEQKNILDKEQSEEIRHLLKASNRKLCIITLIISSCALITSIISIVMQLLF